MARDWRQAECQRSSAGGITPGGRRKFGTVRDAIVEVPEQAGCELRVRYIHEGVEQLLGEPVSGSSVKTYLRHGCQCKTPLFEYLGRRGYRLAR